MRRTTKLMLIAVGIAALTTPFVGETATAQADHETTHAQLAASSMMVNIPYEQRFIQGIPPDCRVYRKNTYSNASASFCTQRAHRAAAKCKTYSSGTNWYFGPWQDKNQESVAICPQDTQALLDMSVDYPD